MAEFREYYRAKVPAAADASAAVCVDEMVCGFSSGALRSITAVIACLRVALWMEAPLLPPRRAIDSPVSAAMARTVT